MGRTFKFYGRIKRRYFLRQYAQTNPLQAYTMEGYNMFEQLLNRIDDTIAQFLLKANIEQNTQRRQVVKGRTNEPSEQEHKKPIKKEKNQVVMILAAAALERNTKTVVVKMHKKRVLT